MLAVLAEKYASRTPSPVSLSPEARFWCCCPLTTTQFEPVTRRLARHDLDRAGRSGVRAGAGGHDQDCVRRPLAGVRRIGELIDGLGSDVALGQPDEILPSEDVTARRTR